ncbi:hypothetical protein [Pseudomonas oryzihabitans]|uniref:hypothetical protein n=1 Tax=Pseudomonas oryzihabitans TaxID=47885 RepID=UPI00289E8D0C|nr:hypothetical protein [Pseudomonas oryzihabitans]
MIENWLTVDDASKWLASELGVSYFSIDNLWRDIRQDFLQAHYWPQGSQKLGLFYIEPHAEATEIQDKEFFNAEHGWFTALGTPTLFAEMTGPMPFAKALDFLQRIKSFQKPINKRTNLVRGITANVYATKGPVGCYGIGPDKEPISLDLYEYSVLIHIDELKSYKQRHPKVRINPLPETELMMYGRDGRIQEPITANCAKYGSLRKALPAPEQSQPSASQTASLYKTLALAAHVIADLCEQADSSKTIASQKYNIKTKKNGGIKIQPLAMLLSEKAEHLELEGHGAGHRGFEERLREALKRLPEPHLGKRNSQMPDPD